MISGPKIRFNL